MSTPEGAILGINIIKRKVPNRDGLLALSKTYLLSDPTVGFNQGPSDPTRMLPDVDNPSDHYPVGAVLRAM